MAIAHSCLGCGLDLARVRTIRDMHYGLPLVICPGCSTAAIRRRHPLQRLWRSFIRTEKSLWMMFWHIVVLMALMGINIGAIAFVSRLPERSRDDGFHDYRSEIILAMVVVPLVTGLW